MKRSRLPQAALAALLLLCLAGCGLTASQNPASQQVTSPTPSAVQTQQPAAPSPEPSRAGDEGTPTQPGPSPDEAAWSYDSQSGVLTFEGRGPLSAAEPENADDLPFGWASLSGEVTSIVIGEGITRIPSYSFYGFGKVESVSLPSTLTSIGTMAFFQCAIEEMILPNAVEHIERGAFSHCRKLRACDIQEKVTVLEPFVFEECVMLENITFQEGLTELKEGCLMCCDKINVLVIPSSVTNLEELYAGGVRVMVFMGDPPALPQNPATGEYWLGYGDLMVYYPAGNEAWRRLAASCRDDIVWIEGIPEDGE